MPKIININALCRFFDQNLGQVPGVFKATDKAAGARSTAQKIANHSVTPTARQYFFVGN